MRKVSDGDLLLLLDARKEGPFVVDLEDKDAVLVREAKRGGESRAVGGVSRWGEGEALEGREHAEFELEGVGGR